MAPEYVDYKDCERSEKGRKHADPVEVKPHRRMRTSGSPLSPACPQIAATCPHRSPTNPQAVGTTDPQATHAKVNNYTGVMPGGCNPPASVGRCPRHANEEMFGMADTTTPRRPQARPGSPERPADRSTARRWLATCRRILENSQGR